MSADLFRVYELQPGQEYPPEWHAVIKHAVREEAGHRCVRCGHPYEKGDGQWSECDEHCTHPGPVRGVFEDGNHTPVWDHPGTLNDPALVAVEAAWRILTVHHLNGVKRDCRWWNLVALCQRCHLRVQRVVVMERVWPWAHSSWFEVYAAGWYAHAYLREDLTRAETVERLDELLSLERIA